MISRKLLRIGMFLLLLLASTALIGCSTTVKLHPVEKSDIFSVEKGSVVSHADGSNTPVEKDGFFLSKPYLDEIAKVIVESK